MASFTTSIAPLRLAERPIRARPLATKLCLAATDLAALVLSVGISVALKTLLSEAVSLESYLRLWPFLFVFPLVYAASGLYSIVALSPPEELQRGSICSAVLFVLLGASTVSFRGAQHHVTWTLLLALALSVILMPLLRACVRQKLASKPWWGYPAVIFGAGKAGEHMLRILESDPATSLKPVAFIDPHRIRGNVLGVPVFSRLEQLTGFVAVSKGTYAVFVNQDLPEDSRDEMIDHYRSQFSHVLLIPELSGVSSLWVNSKNLNGILGLEMGHLETQKLLKRTVDLVLAALFSVFAGPLAVLIAILIRLDSPGPVLYNQVRIGKEGRLFRAWKFRSMVVNSKEMLEEFLTANPEARVEWAGSQKLKNDPRVTRIGRILRKTSLDELPQVWNVLRGDMSFVGPRPIVESEVHHYGRSFGLYKAVKGGITGLWQVSGRNDTTYAERVSLDSFYARNWSVWLDLCILVRTLSVVLFGRGAY